MIYLDGSALCRFLPGVRHYEAFGAWAQNHIDELVTTQLGFTEFRQAAELYPRSAAERVAGIVDLVRAGVAVIRFSDDNVAISSHATAVLKPFAALHLGAAVAHEQVDTIVTYDPALANVARIYELAVVSPGLPDGWYFEYQGPPEHWKPVALDAPYDPGAEFEVAEVAPPPDAYEVALEEARREAAAKASVEQAAAESVSAEDGDPKSASADDGDAESVSDATSDSEEISDLERALRDAEAVAGAGGDGGDDELDDARGEEDGASVDDGPAMWGAVAGELGEATASAPPGRSGTYRPRIEAWHEGDAEEDRPQFEEDEAESDEADASESGTSRAEASESGTSRAEASESGTSQAEASESGTSQADASQAGGGLPWSGRPEPIPGSPKPGSLPPGPLLRTPPLETPLPQTPPALAPPAPIESVGIPNLPREERGVPPVMPPARESIGSAVRRPMFETDPHPESRASRPPDPVPPVPPEESSPLTVPIKWNVELDEPEAYLPLRFDSESARVLPSAPVSFAGGQGGLTIQSAGSVSVPALEPTGPQPGPAILSDFQTATANLGAGSPMSARERKAAEKAAKKEDERRAKSAKKTKGAAPPSVPPSAPPAASSEEWKLEDVLNFGPKKRGS